MGIATTLPTELISRIIKNCDLKTKTHFLLVNRELYREAQRLLRPVITRNKNKRIETVEAGEFKIVTIFVIDGNKGDNNERYDSDKSGNKEYLWKREYFKNDKKHREEESGSSKVVWYPNGNKRCEVWHANGKKNRKNGPAKTVWHLNQNKMFEHWYKDGKYYRSTEDVDPTSLGWYVNGRKNFEWYTKNGRPHRKGKPAVIRWYENGNKKMEQWFLYDKRPTVGTLETFWHENGNKKYEWVSTKSSTSGVITFWDDNGNVFTR